MTVHLTELRSYHVRHAGPTAARAAADIAALLESGVTLIDVSRHDRHADMIALQATTPERSLTMTPDHAGTVSDVVDRLHQDGFAVWPRFATGDQLDRLTAAVAATLASEHAQRFPKSTRAFDVYRLEGAFIELIADPRLAALLDAVLGTGHLLSDLSINSVNPGQPVDDWHIDYPFTEMHTMLPGGIIGLQCVLAMSPFSPTSGATNLLPATHRQPRQPGTVIAEPVLFEAAPGDLLVMAAAVWHRSGFNAGDTPRDAILLSFVERWVRPMSAPTDDLIQPVPDRLAELLGLIRPVETINGVPI